MGVELLATDSRFHLWQGRIGEHVQGPQAGHRMARWPEKLGEEGWCAEPRTQWARKGCPVLWGLCTKKLRGSKGEGQRPRTSAQDAFLSIWEEHGRYSMPSSSKLRKPNLALSSLAKKSAQNNCKRFWHTVLSGSFILLLRVVSLHPSAPPCATLQWTLSLKSSAGLGLAPCSALEPGTRQAVSESIHWTGPDFTSTDPLPSH